MVISPAKELKFMLSTGNNLVILERKGIQSNTESKYRIEVCFIHQGILFAPLQ